MNIWWIGGAGTALGAWRAGRMIPYDYDGDIIVDKSLTKDKWATAMHRLTALGYLDLSHSPAMGAHNLKSSPRSFSRRGKRRRGSHSHSQASKYLSSRVAPAGQELGQGWRDEGDSVLRIGLQGRAVDVYAMGEDGIGGTPSRSYVGSWDGSHSRVFQVARCTSFRTHQQFVNPGNITRHAVAFGQGNRTVWLPEQPELEAYLKCVYSVKDVKKLVKELQCEGHKDANAGWKC